MQARRPSNVSRYLKAITIFTLAGLLLTSGFLPSRADQLAAEFAVKATYLYKFAPFVEWPENSFASPQSPFIICLVGEDPFGATLDQAVANQRIVDHPIEIRRFAMLNGVQGCHIVFAGGSSVQPVAQTLNMLRGTSALSVTDAADNGAAGIINFVIRGKRVRFEIDDEAARGNNLKISSKLMALAVNGRD